MNRPTTGAWLRIAAMLGLALTGLSFGAAPSALAHGVPGAQAEALTDTGPDPYTFPRIELCCERRHGDYGGHHKKTSTSSIIGPVITVNCAVPSNPTSVGSLREAVDRIAPGGTIYVTPGAACDVSGLIINRPLTIQSTGAEYGARAQLTGGGACAVVGTAALQAPVRFVGLDMEACIALDAGMLELVQDNLSWRGQGAAIEMRGGSLRINQSTVRARETALNSTGGSLVEIGNFSRLATTQDGRFVVRLNVEQAKLSNVLLKGARIGIFVENVNSSFSLSDFEIVRVQEDDPYPAQDPGDQGIVIGDAHPLHDLPWLSGMDARTSSIHGGKIAGFRTGIFLGTSTKATVDSVSIFGSVVGIHVGAGAFANLNGNRISGSAAGQRPETGIKLEPGARGTAAGNRIGCKSDDCVCYGSDCSSRSERVFGGGAFRTSNTSCNSD